MVEQQRVLLPKNVKPAHYDLFFVPDLTNFTFRGEADISLHVLEETSEIVLHSIELQFQAVSVTCSGNTQDISIASIKFDESLERATIPLSHPISNEASLKIRFTGILNDQMKGFYRSRFQDKFIATTQFEATDARRAFPCWDEPAVKATFQISLLFDSDLIGLSNMPVVSSENINEEGKALTKVKFDKTPIMSTYLLAMVVGKFDYVQGKTKEGVEVRVYTPPGKSEEGQYALSMATRTLSYYTEYFNIAYPLPKCDMIAIADFAAGAMENWGLITYREVDLLIHPTSSSVANKQRVAYVVAHELAHQWFGNLVTMEWWKELWLNEGFASWVGNLASHKFYPEWDVWTQFGSDYFARAQSLDSLLSSHPIEVEVYSSHQIDEIFDTISYCKGASIIHMIASYLGEENFKKGLNIYLNRFSYRNAVTEDLWQALSEASGKDVKSFMDNWTKTTGFPVITIEQSDSNPLEFHVTQHRFLAQGLQDGDQSLWNCFIGFTSALKFPEITYIEFTEREKTITLSPELAGDGSHWIKANAGQSGFFHVKYSPALLSRLQSPIESKQLPAVDRMAIQKDIYALARAGIMKTSDYLQVTSFFKNEDDYSVLNDIALSFSGITTAFADQDYYPQLESFFASVFQKTVEKLGWEENNGDSDNVKLLRSLVLRRAAEYGNREIIDQAMKYFALPDDQLHSKISSDLIGVIYYIAVKYGGDNEYNKVLEVFRTSQMQADRLKALRAISASEANIIKTLEFSLSDEVRNQDRFYVNVSTSATQNGRKITWDFVKSNFQKYNQIYDTQKQLLCAVVKYSIDRFNTLEEAAEVEEFFAANPFPAGERTIAQVLENIRTRAAWVTRDVDDVRSFLKTL